MHKKTIFAASILALVVAGSVSAQGALVGIEDLDERIEDIQDDVSDEFARGEDSERFGPNQFAQGWTGDVSLGLAATTGNTDTFDLSFGGRARYGNGPWNHTFGFAGEFANDNGVKNKEEIYATYDVNRYLNESFYVFGLGSVTYDGFGSNKWDAFLGVGPGYRIINTADTTWRVQAGPGVRYTEDQMGASSTDLAGIASSRFYRAFTETVSLTNDTDVVFSQEDTVATNDLGVNFRLTDRLSTRTSIRTEYDSNPDVGEVSTDNTFRVSLVYGF